MKNEQLAEQALLASEILRTGHPWMFCLSPKAEWRQAGDFDSPIYQIQCDNTIRLALATPGDGRPLHNPDNLTAEQVGAGWRLALENEDSSNFYFWRSGFGWASPEGIIKSNLENKSRRTQLSTPWPEKPKPDPYAELKSAHKAAHKAGKVIQYRSKPEFKGLPIDWEDMTLPPSFCMDGYDFRIKPEPVMIPLGPDDCPPGSVFRGVGWSSGMYRNVWEVCETGVAWTKDILTDWNLLQDNYEINRSIPKTGKWDKDAWVSCSKPQT